MAARDGRRASAWPRASRTPEIDRIAEAAASEGGAAKVCGAGGGGMVAVWAVPGTKREGRGGASGPPGFKIVAFRLDLRGLEVD